jgi:hypothetical protein
MMESLLNSNYALSVILQCVSGSNISAGTCNFMQSPSLLLEKLVSNVLTQNETDSYALRNAIGKISNSVLCTLLRISVTCLTIYRYILQQSRFSSRSMRLIMVIFQEALVTASHIELKK